MSQSILLQTLLNVQSEIGSLKEMALHTAEDMRQLKDTVKSLEKERNVRHGITAAVAFVFTLITSGLIKVGVAVAGLVH